MTPWFFALGGAAGAAQAALLARATFRRAGPLGLSLRLFVAGAVLLWAALAGHVLAGAAGWASGFGLAAALALWRWR